MTMRMPADEQAYQDSMDRGETRPINTEPVIDEYAHWVIVENRYPHTRIAHTNHMLVLKRSAHIWQLTAGEQDELLEILHKLAGNYDCVLYNLGSMSSVKDIPHFHLYRIKTAYK